MTPAVGTDVGGTTVTITGTRLAHATLVTFGGVAGRIIADSSTQITAVSPPSTGTMDVIVTAAAITTDSGTRITGTSRTGTGTVDIAVTTTAGASKPTAADHYTYTAPRPAVTGISPDSGSTAGGTTVSITGTGLAGGTMVTFGGVAGRIIADSNTQVTVTSPPGTGTVTITVITPAGTSKTTAAGHYRYTRRPKRTQSISFTAPASGTVGSSATLSAKGGGSRNPVIFSVDRTSGPGVCTVSGRTVTYAAVGSCVIDANQAGNRTHAAAPQAQQTITVTGKPQSIIFTNPGAFGFVDGSATLVADGGGSGNPVMFSVDPGSGAGVCAVSGSTVSYTAAGSCVIDANQAGDAAYAAAPQAQLTITVTSVQKRAQSISFTAPASGTVGGSATLSATASSGLPVVLSVDPGSGAGVCAVSGSTVSYTAAGSCIIDANQAGDAAYAAAPRAQQTITVTSVQKRAQSITFTEPPREGTVGGSVTLSATASSGLPVVLSVDPGSGAGVCAVSGSTVSYTAAGSCIIDANQAGNGTYAAAPQAQLTIEVISVQKQTQSITFTEPPREGTVGGSVTLSATASSGLPVVLSVDPGSGAGVCAVSGSTVSYTAAGSCIIDANQAGNGTYAAAPQAQLTIEVISVQKQTQSITFTEPPREGTVGGSVTLSATASSGLPVVLSVDPGSGAGVCAVSGSTVSYTAAGSCVIDANQAGNATYAAAPQAQLTITVTGKSQSITFTKAPEYGNLHSSVTLSVAASSGLPVVLSVDPGSGAGVCTVSGSTVTFNAVGTCVIDANQAGNGIYAAAPLAQLTITVVNDDIE